MGHFSRLRKFQPGPGCSPQDTLETGQGPKAWIHRHPRPPSLSSSPLLLTAPPQLVLPLPRGARLSKQRATPKSLNCFGCSDWPICSPSDRTNRICDRKKLLFGELMASSCLLFPLCFSAAFLDSHVHTWIRQAIISIFLLGQFFATASLESGQSAAVLALSSPGCYAAGRLADEHVYKCRTSPRLQRKVCSHANQSRTRMLAHASTAEVGPLANANLFSRNMLLWCNHGSQNIMNLDALCQRQAENQL